MEHSVSTGELHVSEEYETLSTLSFGYLRSQSAGVLHAKDASEPPHSL